MEPGQETLIDITIKTLDGQNRTFNVPQNLNVRQFKENISGTISIPADNQRLIFQGRVMQDEKVLKDYDIHGKVIHLVQRAPPTSTSGASNTSTPTTSTPSAGRPHVPIDGNLFDVQIHLGRVQNTPTSREARARIRQADFNLRLVNDVLNQLEQRLGSRSGDNASQDTSESLRPRTTEAASNSISDNQCEFNMDTSSPSEADRPRQTDNRDQPGQQPRGSTEPAGGVTGGDQRVGLMATDLANFLDQVLSTNDRVTSHIRLYRDLLRNEVTYPAMSREAQDAQEIVSRATEIFHALGHMLHSLSDVVVDMGTDMPRQAVATPPVPFPISGSSMAIPIHMNVRARQGSNGQRPRPPQSTSTAASTAGSTTMTPTPSTTASSTFSPSGGVAAAAGSTTTASNITSTSTIGSGLGPFQIPPMSLNLPSNVTTAGDPTVMVEVFPAGVTVHDIRAVVTQGGIEDDSDSSTDSVDTVGGGRTNITITSATSIETPAEVPAPTPTSTVITSSSAAPASYQPPSTSTPWTTNSGTFTTPTSTSSAFIFGPSANISFREMPNFGIGQVPNVPGLPPGMLQNILGSILNSHGVRPDQPVQVNVVQQLTATGVPTSRPSQTTQPQTIQDLPVDSERLPPGIHLQQPINLHHPTNRAEMNPQNPARTDSTVGARTNTATNTFSTAAPSVTNSATSTSSSTSIFPLAFNLPNIGPQSVNTGTSTDPTTSTNSQSTNTARPQFHFQRSPAGPRPRTQAPGLHRPGLASRAYVDPYLPCSSTHYMSPTAVAAFNALQMQPRGQQPQQQVPNLSTMVSGMVGEIIEQVGQAAVNGGAQANTTLTSTSSNLPSLATRNAGGQQPPPLDPMEMFSHLISGSVGGASPGSAAFEVGALVSNILQGTNNPAATGTTTTTARGTTAAPAAWTLADLFTRVRPTNEDSIGEANVIISLLEAVAPHMGLTDLFSLVMGNTRVLNQVRGPLREFVGRQVSHYGSVDQVVEAALNDIYPEIQFLQSLVQVKDGLDMAQSLRNCLRIHLSTIFSAINSDKAGPQGDFGSHIYSLWMKMLADSIGLCIYCIHDGQRGFSNMVQNYMPRMTQGMSPAITVWMTTSLQDILESFYRNHSVTEADIISYIVKLSDRHAIPSQREQGQSESPGLSAGAVVSSDSLSGASPPGPMDIKESPSSQPPRAKVPRTIPEEDIDGFEVFEDAQESFTSRPPPRARPSTISTQAGRVEGAVGGSRDVRNGRNSDDWQSVIPQDWIPVISRDIVRQQEQKPQPPLSDAYLQGLPAKRRRMMALEHAGEMGNMPLYLPASLTRAARAADAEPISSEENMAQEAADETDLQTELEREMTRVLASRISSDSDFGPDRFPNAKEYFHKSRRH